MRCGEVRSWEQRLRHSADRAAGGAAECPADKSWAPALPRGLLSPAYQTALQAQRAAPTWSPVPATPRLTVSAMSAAPNGATAFPYTVQLVIRAESRGQRQGGMRCQLPYHTTSAVDGLARQAALPKRHRGFRALGVCLACVVRRGVAADPWPASLLHCTGNWHHSRDSLSGGSTVTRIWPRASGTTFKMAGLVGTAAGGGGRGLGRGGGGFLRGGGGFPRGGGGRRCAAASVAAAASSSASSSQAAAGLAAAIVFLQSVASNDSRGCGAMHSP